MLVLSRSVGEKIVIDASICVKVVSMRGNEVRLGITAPESVRVDRAEVHERRGGRVRSTPDPLFPPSSQEEMV
jgi:carbon storage regulator